MLRYSTAISEKKIIEIPFVSIFDYFFWMKRISEVFREYDESRVLFYSAAAVSDFYLKQRVILLASPYFSLPLPACPHLYALILLPFSPPLTLPPGRAQDSVLVWPFEHPFGCCAKTYSVNEACVFTTRNDHHFQGFF